MLQVFLCRYQDLSDDEVELVPQNGCGAERASYIRVIHNGKHVRLESDAMEPEDASFYRDLSWIPDAIVEAYKLGFQDGKVIRLEHNPEQSLDNSDKTLAFSELSNPGEHSKLCGPVLKA